MTPLELYQEKINSGVIQADALQLPVMEQFESIFEQLCQHDQSATHLIKKISKRFKLKQPVKGMYLWGSVGIGKTFLMDCFYQCLPIKKMRIHFHQFMWRIHDEMKKIQGKKNPLQLIAKQLAEEARVICFDEFFVSDIADAMLLGELFRCLFQNGITLITSSNIPPDQLYKDGLQRERFLPAIELLKEHTTVIHLHSEIDYRQQHIRSTGVYYTPLDQTAAANMENCFIHFSDGAESFTNPITICNRPIQIIKQAGSVVWFDFNAICGRPRSQNDYLEIAKFYHTILIENLQGIKASEKDMILSFIYLVDIFYDAHARLVISASVPIHEIYTTGEALTAFQRTSSRLIEMQSEDYIYPGSTGPELTNL